MTIGEDTAGMDGFAYECPDCISRKYRKPISREEYYKQFQIGNDERQLLPGNTQRFVQ